MRYGRSPTSSRNRTAPAGGANGHGVPSDPTGADWFDVTLKEDGWHRKVGENDTGPPALADKDLRKLLEWLVT